MIWGRVLLILALLLGGAATAEERSSLWPAVPPATGEPHPEGNAWWRANHMDLMKHDRDLTMREGNRQIGASLKGCFDCHTAKDAAGNTLTYADDGHFCRTCHDYAAVKVDCFTCHRSTPDGVDETAAHAGPAPRGPVTATAPGDIVAWLGRIGREDTQ